MIVKNRLVFLIFLFSVLFSLIIAKVSDLQVSQGSHFQTLAGNNTSFTTQLPAERGVFLDRYREPLVKNLVWYSSTQESQKLFSEEHRVEVAEIVPLLATNSASMRQHFQRSYPYGPATAHVLGYIGPVSKEDIIGTSYLGINDNVGKVGLEKTYDQILQGKKGSITYAIDALGQKIREIQRVDSTPGPEITTTIDPYLSQIALDALGQARGAIVIVDNETGGVISMVSSPSYDPNLFREITNNQFEEKERQLRLHAELNDDEKRFFNRALSAEYPPGSVFKPVTALAALESGKMTADTVVLDEGVLKVGDYTYANWFYTQYGGMDGEIALRRALARSNDIYFYKAAEFAGAYELARWAKLLGFGSPIAMNLSGSARGLVPDPSWKEQERKEQWFLGNTYHFGIGQGDLLVTPVQMAQLMQELSARGVQCPLHLVQNQSTQCNSLGIDEDYLNEILSGMHDACSPGGTGYHFFENNKLFQQESDAFERLKLGSVACKTGTAEFGGVDGRGYRRTHAWFVMSMSISPTPTKSGNELSNESSELFNERSQWLSHMVDKAFPRSISLVVLLESDDDHPYREGSKDAGAVAKEVYNFITDRKATVEASGI